MVYTGKQLSKKVLEVNGHPMTSEEIWKYKLEHSLDTSVSGETPWRTLQAQMYMDIKEKGDKSDFYQYSRKPVSFYLSSKKDYVTSPAANAETTSKVDNKRSNEQNEKRMHPFLVSFLCNDPHFKCHCMTIDASRSKNKGNSGSNKWRYPDIVGVHYPFDDDYGPEILDLFACLEQNLIKLFSFEIKQELNIGNVRESFFQAISNSSWANEGYLVAATIDDDVHDELRSLSQSFGIGVIHLNLEYPAQSKILFPWVHGIH